MKHIEVIVKSCFVYVGVYSCFALPGCFTTKTTNPGRAKLYTVLNQLLIPEGIAIHPRTGAIYLSSLHLNKVVSVQPDGLTTDLFPPGEGGFMKGLGMKFNSSGHTLWVCSSDGNGKTGLFEIDAISGKVVQQYRHDSALFFNDLVIAENGDIFVTDFYKGAVFRYVVGTGLELWLKADQLSLANGIALSSDGSTLFVASGNKGIQKIDVMSKQVESVTKGKRTDYGVDGLVTKGNQLIGVIGWPQDRREQHRVIRYHLSADHYLVRADTIAINASFLDCPTTAAVRKNSVFVLSTTNLGLYNRHTQHLEKVSDSLALPIVARFELN